MSLSVSCDSVPPKRTLSSLLAGHVVKRPKHGDGQRLQEAAIQLLEQQQDLCSLLAEAGNPVPCNTLSLDTGEQSEAASESVPSALTASLLVCVLRRQASQLGVPLTVLTVKTVLERLTEITGAREVEEDRRRELLTSSQRVQLCVLLESCRELLSDAALCPRLLWKEYRRDQKLPKLDFVYHLHVYHILSLKDILESDEGVRSWLVSQLKALCSWNPPQGEDEARRVRGKVLSTLVGVLVGSGFQSEEAERRCSVLCRSALDDMLFWLLDTVDKNENGSGAALWCHLLDASLCGGCVSSAVLQRFLTHSLTQTLTFKPQLTVSDAVAVQNEWIFAKANRLLTTLFRKLAVVFTMEQLLFHLQQVLETHEVNWKHVLCFLSTLLVYNPDAQPSLRELLSRLLSSAFECYDLENMITAFLLARQGALEGPAIFSTYSDWFKVSFGGVTGFHAASKKSLVFLLKFLSDLVPFEPPQYLKVHILHPPYVPAKHRNLLMEYVSLAKTRLADLKESVEEMGLYEDVSGAGSAPVQPECQAVQDVEKAVSLFESTGRISATVMEASIFRRQYFLTRFLTALLKPRILPVKADAWMSFIEALKKAEKIPAAKYSSYVESCQKMRQQGSSAVRVDPGDDPLQVLQSQLQELQEMVQNGHEAETSAQLSRISHSLSVIIPGQPDQLTGPSVIKLHTDMPPSPQLNIQVADMILRSFCQCTLDASRGQPPNKQNQWASRFIGVLLGNTQLLSVLLHRLWHLLHSQVSLLSATHMLGLAVFVVHLHASMSDSPLVELAGSAVRPEPVTISKAVSSALCCRTHNGMLFCARFCVAAICYGLCRGDSLTPEQQRDYIPCSLYKKLLYLIPRLLPEARRTPAPEGECPEEERPKLWSSITDSSGSWRTTAWCLWRLPAFYQLQNQPAYQLVFTEWLSSELRVQRSEDGLSDPERTEYQQWACLELFLSRPEEQGGCGGDMTELCSQLLRAVMDQQLPQQNPQNPESGTCLPDILSRLQEVVYEMEVAALSGRRGNGVCDFLFELVSQRFSASVNSSSALLSPQLSRQHTINSWNRVLLALPSATFIKVTTEGGRTTLDCNNLIKHVNQHQRMACSSECFLSVHVTTHFLRGLLMAAARCSHPADEFDKAWSKLDLQCPLLLISAAYWWERLSAVLSSLWRRLCNEDGLPQHLTLLKNSHTWACSLKKGQWLQPPPAPAFLLAASLYRMWRGSAEEEQSFYAAVSSMQADTKCKEVLVFLLSLCVNRYLSTLLLPQETSLQRARSFCTEVLSVLADSTDWLLIFKLNEHRVYHVVTMVTPDEHTRLLPWAFYSLLLHQSPELLLKAMQGPGFLNTAVSCYMSLLRLFLDGHTPSPIAELPDSQVTQRGQVEASQILSSSKSLLLRAISKSPHGAMSSRQMSQLESQCADLDPEVAAALTSLQDPHRFSPEMDFL